MRQLPTSIVRTVLDRQLAILVLSGKEFTADHLTGDGSLTLDQGQHAPNGKQNGLGAFIRGAARNGYITWTGDVDISRSPKRKGGMIRVWQGTPDGVVWAQALLSDR